MKKRNRNKYTGHRNMFRVRNFRWLLLTDALLVAGAVASFGLVAQFTFGMTRHSAIFMLGMILPMSFVVGQCTALSMRAIRKHMNALLDGIQQVAEGNLDICLESKAAGEYEMIYQNFNQMVRELKDTKAEMENFVNEFSHEIKTPLTSIHGFAELLLDAELKSDRCNTEHLQYLQIIADESLRLSELSQKTLLLTKVEACEIITDKEPFSLSEQIKQCTILMLPQIEKKKISLSLEISDIYYMGSPELLEHVWINLLGNAVKFTPENGEIEITAVNKEEWIEVRIADNGKGMDKETLENIFRRYYQGSSEYLSGGNGIGLAIAHRIVTLCGGEIKAESVPGEGSTFTVKLPPQEQAI